MHTYQLQLDWTGNTGKGTSTYRSYERSYTVAIDGKPTLEGSSDPTFRGDAAKYNPEELLVAALSSCHLLWYLHLCAEAGIVVTAYADTAIGRMQLESDGGGAFTQVILQPTVTVADAAHSAQAEALHARANQLCFIARSVNFPVLHRPTIHAADTPI